MTQPPRLILNNCQIIDARSPSPREGSVVISEGGIQDVSPMSITSYEDASVIDLNGAFLLPGLWDVHTHIGRGIPDSEARDESTAERAIRAGRDCMEVLKLGITGMRVVGERDFIDVAWKRAFDSGAFVGPSLFTCGHFLKVAAPWRWTAPKAF